MSKSLETKDVDPEHEGEESFLPVDQQVEATEDDPVVAKSFDDSDARVVLLVASLILLLITILLAFITAWFGSDATFERVQVILNLTVPVETLILGAAVSYYFKTDRDR